MDLSTQTLKSLLYMARSVAPEIYQSKEFWQSNMDLAGHLFLRLTGSGLYKKEIKILPTTDSTTLTKGLRRTCEVVAEEYLKSAKCENSYELKVLEAIKQKPMWDFEIVRALGLDLYISSGVTSALQGLKAKNLIYQGEDYKYHVKEKVNPFEVQQ